MFEFRLPDTGEGLHEAEIVRWLVREGDTVARDQALVEVMTDKATVEIPSPVAGRVVSLGFLPGQTARVGDVLVVLEPEGGAAPVAAQAGLRRVLAAPSVRKLARDLGIDLAGVPATGPGGRITVQDVQRFAAAMQPASVSPAPPPAGAGQPAPASSAPPAAAVQDTPATPGAPAVPGPPALPAMPELQTEPGAARTAAAGPEEVVPLVGLRRRIAERMTQAWREVPHVTTHEEADVTALADLRERLLLRAEAAGVRLTWLPFVIKAVTAALKEYPCLNATFDSDRGAIVFKRYYHIGVAIAVPDGLLVPVVRDADRKSLLDLAREIAALTERAQARSLTAGELQGSTFTITNYGRFGGSWGTPIINPPEVAILGVGRVAERPVARDGQVTVRLVMPLSLSFDHRVIDGEGASGFLEQVLRYLRDPDELVLRMG